jgi:formylglycine-generating enzyme required for sulfatase activity
MTLPLPGGSQRLGWREDEPGFTFEADRGYVTEALQGGDIDTAPVSWQQYLEFIRDGGYEDRRWWSEAGWRWREALGRTAPRQVLSCAGAVILERGGRQLRVAPQQPVLQVSAHEAQAWCAWAGRRLPTEAEWQAAALGLSGRGWRWGECWEWTLDRLARRPGPLAEPLPDGEPIEPAAGHPQHLGAAWGRDVVLRGGSLWARRRLVHPRRRWHAAPENDRPMIGFRSCGL